MFYDFAFRCDRMSRRNRRCLRRKQKACACNPSVLHAPRPPTRPFSRRTEQACACIRRRARCADGSAHEGTRENGARHGLDGRARTPQGGKSGTSESSEKARRERICPALENGAPGTGAPRAVKEPIGAHTATAGRTRRPPSRALWVSESEACLLADGRRARSDFRYLHGSFPAYKSKMSVSYQ